MNVPRPGESRDPLRSSRDLLRSYRRLWATSDIAWLAWREPRNVGEEGARRLRVSQIDGVVDLKRGSRPWNRLLELEWTRRSGFFSFTGWMRPNGSCCGGSCGARTW